MKARAVVFEEPGRVEMRDVELRAPEPDEVVVRTSYSSISSGTERLLFAGKLPPLPQFRYPLVPGYEAAGTVIDAGRDVTNVKPGDEVFVGGSTAYTGIVAAFGGQSSTVVKKADAVVPLQGIPLAHAPLLALAATALHGVRRLGFVKGRRAGVLGLGAVGQLAAGFLRAQGAEVIVADRAPARLAIAPADERYDVAETPLAAQLTVPLDVAIEATGNPGELVTCARALATGGQILLLSYYDELRAPFAELFVKEVTLTTSKEWTPADLRDARDIIASGAVDLAPLAGHVVPIDRFEAAYRTAFEDPSTLKVVLQWA